MKRFFILLALLTFAIAAQAQDITVGLISGLYGDAEAAFVRLKEAGFKACQTGYSLEWNEDTAKEFKRLKNIRVRGVMGMATNTDDEQVVRADFEQLANHFNHLKPLFGEEFDTLSMGMSDDYKLAIECGSTMVRIGSSIFGNRY